jgi:hypothetical protein
MPPEHRDKARDMAKEILQYITDGDETIGNKN